MRATIRPLSARLFLVGGAKCIYFCLTHCSNSGVNYALLGYLEGAIKMAQGTKFPIHTNGDLFKIVVLGIGDTIRERDNKAPNGASTYSSGCLLKRENKDGSVSTDKSASIHVLKPSQVGAYEGLHVARGDIWLQPYQQDGGRMAYSITVEELVPINQGGKP